MFLSRLNNQNVMNKMILVQLFLAATMFIEMTCCNKLFTGERGQCRYTSDGAQMIYRSNKNLDLSTYNYTLQECDADRTSNKRCVGESIKFVDFQRCKYGATEVTCLLHPKHLRGNFVLRINVQSKNSGMYTEPENIGLLTSCKCDVKSDVTWSYISSSQLYLTLIWNITSNWTRTIDFFQNDAYLDNASLSVCKDDARNRVVICKINKVKPCRNYNVCITATVNRCVSNLVRCINVSTFNDESCESRIMPSKGVVKVQTDYLLEITVPVVSVCIVALLGLFVYFRFWLKRANHDVKSLSGLDHAQTSGTIEVTELQMGTLPVYEDISNEHHSEEVFDELSIKFVETVLSEQCSEDL